VLSAVLLDSPLTSPHFASHRLAPQVRSAVLGAENEAARVGGISAPFIVLVGISTGQPAMPFIIFGVTALVAGVAIFTLPETLGTTLPDTMAGGSLGAGSLGWLRVGMAEHCDAKCGCDASWSVPTAHW
jgi:hypothetical protein